MDAEIRKWCARCKHTDGKYYGSSLVPQVFCKITSRLHTVLDECDIADASAADVVEVVRCKDCKHCDMEDENERWCLGWGSPARLVAPDSYCSHGIRKEGQG